MPASDRPLSSNEITAYWRSSEPEISRDRHSRKLCSADGARFALEFARGTYPRIGRHIAVRNRFFLDRAVGLVNDYEFDGIVSLGSGLSLLTYLIAQSAPSASQLIDSDLPDVLRDRSSRLSHVRGCFDPAAWDRVHMEPFDIRRIASEQGILQALCSGLKSPVVLLEGVTYFLDRETLERLFAEIDALDRGALIVDYWPDDAPRRSRVFRQVTALFSGGIAETVHSCFAPPAFAGGFRRLRVMEDVCVSEAEREYTPEPELLDPDQFVPARFVVARPIEA